MRILFIGDIIGKPGRKAVQRLLPGLRREYDVGFVVANGEIQENLMQILILNLQVLVS